MLSAWRPDATSNRNPGLEQMLLDPDTPLDQTLTAAGFPTEFVKIFSSVTTRLVSSTTGRYHIEQRMPSLSLRREIRIAIHPGKQLRAGLDKAARTAAGFDVYPLHHAVVGFSGGYDRYQAFFVAYDVVDTALLGQLGVQRRVERRGWNIIPVAYAQQPSMLGMVVASVTTTTTGDSGGLGDTSASGRTQQPTVAEAELRQHDMDAQRQAYLDEHYDGSLDEYARQRDEYSRRFDESLDAETRTRLQQPENLSLESAQGEIELGNLLRDGETLAQQEARVRLQRDGAGLQRAGNAVAVLSMLAEWMQQALDFRDGRRQLDAAEACLDQRAQNAGPAERENIELVRMHLRAARSDLNWNTGARVVNSANSGVGSFVTAGAFGGGIGLASSGNNAGLRNLTIGSISDALRGVGNCNPPPPCPQLPLDGPPTQELLHTPADQQTHTPGPERAPAPIPVCTGPRAVIVMKYTEKMDRWRNTITFQTLAELSNTRRLQMGATTVDYPERNFRGTSRAIYRQQADLVAQDRGCGYQNHTLG